MWKEKGKNIIKIRSLYTQALETLWESIALEFDEKVFLCHGKILSVLSDNGYNIFIVQEGL